MFGKKKKSMRIAIHTPRVSAETRLWEEMKNDRVYQQLLAENGRLHEEVSSDYSVVNNLNLHSAEQGDALIHKCWDTIAGIELLMPYWKKYNEPLPTLCEPAKRLSMLFEKRGDYENAAFVCVKSIRLGMYQDGTKDGMRGRLSRMVKKGNLEMNAEMKKILGV